MSERELCGTFNNDERTPDALHDGIKPFFPEPEGCHPSGNSTACNLSEFFGMVSVGFDADAMVASDRHALYPTLGNLLRSNGTDPDENANGGAVKNKTVATI